jgi:hypothetical protein
LLPNYVAVLEDNAGRLAEMRACLAEVLPQHEAVFFDNADEMIAWLKEHLPEVMLISLDHDLPLWQLRDGQQVDPGAGRMVADYLSTLEPTCPVIIHSSNENSAPGMMRVLHDAGWPHHRVYPCDDNQWIRNAWIGEIRCHLQPGH